jgi:hypothetical protein
MRYVTQKKLHLVIGLIIHQIIKINNQKNIREVNSNKCKAKVFFGFSYSVAHKIYTYICIHTHTHTHIYIT